MISLLLGLQRGYPKHMCVLCPWDSRDDTHYYTTTIWLPREELAVGRNDVKHISLVDPQMCTCHHCI